MWGTVHKVHGDIKYGLPVEWKKEAVQCGVPVEWNREAFNVGYWKNRQGDLHCGVSLK